MRRNVIKSEALTLLELEHERLNQILAVLENEAAELALSEHHNVSLIEQCLSYMLEYPDACHHPKEDLIANRLRESGSEEADHLEDDHQALSDLTRETVQRFHAHDSTNSERTLRLRKYVNVYRDHIDYENRDFFPRALSTLSQSEFDQIDFSLFDSVDPIFDHAHEQRFAALRKKIISS